MWRFSRVMCLSRTMPRAATGFFPMCGPSPHGKGFLIRDYVPLEFVRFDPDKALEIARGKDGSVPDSIMAGAIATLAALDPARAADWGMPKIDKIKDPHMQSWAVFSLASGLVDTNPALASQLYTRAKLLVDRENPNFAKVISYSCLAALAGRLKNGEAAALVEKTLDIRPAEPYYKGKSVREVVEAREQIGEFVAKGSPELAEKLVMQLPEHDHDWALAEVVRAAVPYDLAYAERLLAELEEIGGNDRGGTYGIAATPVIRAIGKTRPADALAIARKVNDSRYKPDSLMAAALFQPTDTALIALREASDAARPDENDSVDRMSKAAARAFELDQPTGQKLFSAAWQRLDAEREKDKHASDYAYYYSWADPAGSRLMLEAVVLRSVATPDNKWIFAEAALAMTGLDVNRALELTRSLPDNDYWTYDTIMKIAEYVLASTEERRRVDYNLWAHSNTWRPETPASLGMRIWRL